MATFDEAFPAAIKQLDAQGLLLNMQLLRMVDGDESLSREIREALIFEGWAEDRFGVGLARLNKPIPAPTRTSAVAPRSAEESDEVTFASLDHEPPVADWWLMSGGRSQGPFTFPALRLMRRQGRIATMDLVRQGERGVWKCPDDVAGLIDVSDVILPVEVVPRPVESIPIDQSPVDVPAGDVIRLANAPHRSRSGDSAKPDREVTDDGNEYFLWSAGNAVGPISRKAVQERLDAGRLDQDDFVQVGRNGDWQPVSQALGGTRPALRIPRTPTVDSHDDRDPANHDIAAASPSPPFSRPHVAESPHAAVRTGTRSPAPGLRGRNSKGSSSSPAVADGGSSVVRAWNQVAGLVGGSLRLWGILFAATTIAWFVWTSRQPPSAGKIYQEFKACHQKLTELRNQRAVAKNLAAAMAEDKKKILALHAGLKQRAGAARPAEQELLWACEYGLLPMLEFSSSGFELESIFANHMNRAQRLIDPAGQPESQRGATSGMGNDSPSETKPGAP